MSRNKEFGSAEFLYTSVAFLCAAKIGSDVYNIYAKNEPTQPKSVYEDKMNTDNKFTVEYKDQIQPKCVGDVEKTVPQIENGVVKGLTVFCKPEAAAPVK